MLKIIKFAFFFAIAIFLSLFNPSAFADATYPVSNPTYIPMAQTPAATLPTGASTSTVFTLNNVSIVVMRISGTCTGLTSAVQATNDVGATKTNWTSINFWAAPALGTAAGTIDADGSLTSTGLYKIKTDGYTQLRLNISALTAACTVQFTGASYDFNSVAF